MEGLVDDMDEYQSDLQLDIMIEIMKALEKAMEMMRANGRWWQQQ